MPIMEETLLSTKKQKQNKTLKNNPTIAYTLWKSFSQMYVK